MKKFLPENRLLKSRVFIKLFLSYILIISLFFSLYSAFALFQYREAYKEDLKREYELKAETVANALDFELLSAQHIVSSINSSGTLRSLYSTLAVEGDVLNSYMLWQSLEEMKNIKASSNNYGIYNVILLFKDYNKAYTASSVIQLNSGYSLGLERPFLKQCRVSELLDVNTVGNIIFNTEYVIYGDEYSYSSSQREKGSILVLFSKKNLEQKMDRILGADVPYEIYYDDELILSRGQMTELCFDAVSSVNEEVTYKIYVSEEALKMGISGTLALALSVGFLVSAVFSVIAYVVSRRYYSPIGNIEKFIESGELENAAQEEERGDEFGTIIKGIQNLIGENNGYREKMIHISPYAKQGMLHGILNGNMEQDRLQILIDEKYIDLKRMYFALAITNVVYQGTAQVSTLKQKDAIEIIQHVCQEQSTWEMQVDCYVKDLENMFLIVNSDETILLEEVFYKLHEAICKEIDDENCLITIGVGQVEDNISRLNEACHDAMKALEGMLTGGRNTVYFYEPEKEKDKREYYFPKDAQGRLLRAFKENNIGDLHAFLDELYDRNTREYDQSPETIRLLLDELHIQTMNVLKNINGFQTAKIQIDKIEHAATLEEIFAYYHAIYETVCKELTGLLMPKKDIEKLDAEILACIEENYKNPDLSLAFLGEKFGVSNKYISMVCKNHLGKTYLQYVQEKRILYAAELLQTTEKSMEEIAEECGYSSVLTFRRNFKSIMNANPGDYR